MRDSFLVILQVRTFLISLVHLFSNQSRTQPHPHALIYSLVLLELEIAQDYIGLEKE